MYKLKFQIMNDDTEFFLKVVTRQRSQENIEWLKEHGFDDGDSYDIFHYVKTPEEATEFDMERAEYNLSAMHVLYDLKSAEIIKSDKGDDV